MTKLFEQAVSIARELPEIEQDAIAKVLLGEMEPERKWDAVLAKSPENFQQFADDAWTEHTAGRSEKLDLETL